MRRKRFGPFNRSPRRQINLRPTRRLGDIPLQLGAIVAAALVLFSSGDASALVQGDSAGTLAVQVSSAAVAPVQADVTAPLSLASTETASDPVQSDESGALSLGFAADGTVLDSGDARALLSLASTTDTSVSVSADAATTVAIVTDSQAITAVIGADADTMLALQASADVHNSVPGSSSLGGGGKRRRGRRPDAPRRTSYYSRPIGPQTETPTWPPLAASVSVPFTISLSSTGVVQETARGIAGFALSSRSTAALGPNPMEALLLLLDT